LDSPASRTIFWHAKHWIGCLSFSRIPQPLPSSPRSRWVISALFPNPDVAESQDLPDYVNLERAFVVEFRKLKNSLLLFGNTFSSADQLHYARYHVHPVADYVNPWRALVVRSGKRKQLSFSPLQLHLNCATLVSMQTIGDVQARLWSSLLMKTHRD
jgi:hypothetical protein